jgi:hypothetical protein
MADTITIEFVGDTAKLTRASAAGMKRVVSDVKDAEGDVGKSAGRMADKFESAFDDIHGRVGTKVGPGFASLGGKLGGKLLAGFAALGIGGVIVNQLTQAMNIDAGVDKLQAKLGLTAKEAGRLGELAGETYAGAWGESMEEVQGFYAETMRAFPKLTDQALQKVTESAATTADVWDQDFNEVVRAAQNLLVNGLAPDAQTAMDMVATALRDTKGPQDEVLSSLKEYSDHFAVLGLDGANVIGGLTSKWATNEFAIDKVGDAVKELGIRTLDGSETTKTGLKEIGLSVDEVEGAFAKGGDTAKRMTEKIINGIIGIKDPAERARVGVALMGTPFEDLGKNAVPILKDVVEGQKDLADTVKVGNKAYDNAKTKLESWRRQGLMKLTEFLGGEAIPKIEEFSGEVEDFVKSKHIDRFVSHWLGELQEWLTETDDYKQKWRNRWKRSLGGWLQDTDDWKEKWRDRWRNSLGGWLQDTDDYKARWSGRWDRTLGGWLADTDDYKAKWRDRWRNSLGGWLQDTDDWKAKWANRMTDAWTRVQEIARERLQRIGQNTSVQLFALRLMWSNAVERIRERISEWGSNLVGWFKGLPGRITTALGDIGQRIRDKFASLFKGFNIPIKLLFGGDGLGVLGGGDGGLMGVSPNSAVGAAYSALGRPGDVVSGYRPGAITATGNPSYHGMGRALDITPDMGIFNLIRSAFKPRIKELIYSPAGGRQVHNGSDHYYSGITRSMHWDHIHFAMQHGAYVKRPFAGQVVMAERHPEIVSPEPMLREIVRTETRGGPTTINVTVNAGLVTDKARLKQELTAIIRETVHNFGGGSAERAFGRTF